MLTAHEARQLLGELALWHERILREPAALRDPGVRVQVQGRVGRFLRHFDAARAQRHGMPPEDAAYVASVRAEWEQQPFTWTGEAVPTLRQAVVLLRIAARHAARVRAQEQEQVVA
jgi:hypothetical protein